MTGGTPSARIVAALRERISTGELAPGDRVPSTRELTREWGVAMATATKVLTALRLEGLVEAVPGVGTVVATVVPVGSPSGVRRDPEPRRRATPDSGLTQEAIVAAAIAVADAEGVGALSMRRIASDLGVAAMSLYRHVADKDDLLVRMQDATLGGQLLPSVPPDGWRPRLELAARTLWGAFRRHPWLAGQVGLTRPEPTAGGIAYAEWLLAALDGLGLEYRERLNTYILLVGFVRGIAVNLDFEADAQADTGLTSDEWMHVQSGRLEVVLRSGPFPHMREMVTQEFDLDLDVLFETGLRYLLDGFEARLTHLSTKH